MFKKEVCCLFEHNPYNLGYTVFLISKIDIPSKCGVFIEFEKNLNILKGQFKDSVHQVAKYSQQIKLNRSLSLS